MAHQLIPYGLSLTLLQSQNEAWLSVEEFKIFCIICLKAQEGLLHLDGIIHVEKEHKIIVIGDSHARGCAAEIKLNIDEGFKVQGFVTPGTGVSTITTSAKIDIQHLSKQDVVVVWGGSKDVGKKCNKIGY